MSDLDDLRVLLADPSLWAEPSVDLEDRIVAAIAAESATDGTGTRPDTLAAGVPRQRSRSPRRRRWVAPGIAAAVVIAVGVGVGMSRGDTSGGRRFSLALESPTDVASAEGSVDFAKTSSGWKIALHAPGLPRRDGGQFYEAWMGDANGSLVPIGTFNEGADVLLWSGVSPLEFRTVTITREDADGDQASSGETVLLGTLTP